ncbi:hypothetical protein GH714_010156 [Hevea brasiliensis]|uniref:Anthocyanidin 3-O-glucosyltransferase n=1 Tax=Hevea brasiliensis TaxID=3981 RepID=A0A6A6KB04_HEVBR|nr:hypothetical protein GH714_010156 [Hevea brasiliensis]
MTPFLHLSNRLAERGYSSTFLLPIKAIQQLQHLNLYPHLITFHPLTVPHVEGLPEGTQNASDIPIQFTYLLAAAMDTRDQVERVIRDTKPKLIFYDVAHWVPEITKAFGIKAINYSVVSAASIAIVLVPARNVPKDKPITEAELLVPPAGYPSSTVVLRGHEVRSLLFISQPFGLPFLVALKPPMGAATVKKHCPKGSKRGLKVEEWYGGMGTTVNDPRAPISRMFCEPLFMAEELKVAVEVVRDEKAWFSKENLSKSIKSVMDKGSEMGSMLKENHRKWREMLNKGLMNSYVDKFIQNMHELVN